ncbi:MAG TPA: GAF domain-containing protein, partial [Ktedonobacterales bacterium]|nr:GAF domain-containing protein [Ktedonobacterales bacterium]
MTGRGAEQMVNNWVQRRGSDRDVERRTRQIKEIVRLSTQMRADMDLETILMQAVEGIRSTLGFKVAVLNLITPRSDYVEIGATTGLSDVERQRLIKSPPPVARLRAVLRPEFCVGHSYFIGHQYKHLLDGIEGVTLSGPLTSQRAPDAWHAEDVFFVPLKSPRDDELIGILSLDQPEDGKVPSLETIEIIELFASQAALAIDTSLLFRAREQERKAIEVELFELLYHLEQMRQGNLEVRVELSGDTLKPMADSLNAVVASLDDLLSDVQGAGIEVSANATAVRDEAALLASNAEYQAQRIFSAARAVEQMAASVRAIAEIAQRTTSTAREAL